MHKHSDDDVDDLDFASLSIEALLRQAVMWQGPFEMTWKHGTVVQLWYSQDNKVVPYQVRLDEDDCLICAVSNSFNLLIVCNIQQSTKLTLEYCCVFDSLVMMMAVSESQIFLLSSQVHMIWLFLHNLLLEKIALSVF